MVAKRNKRMISHLSYEIALKPDHKALSQCHGTKLTAARKLSRYPYFFCEQRRLSVCRFQQDLSLGQHPENHDELINYNVRVLGHYILLIHSVIVICKVISYIVKPVIGFKSFY